jgi:hypothetical protein
LSHGGNKKARVCHHAPVDYTRLLYKENQMALWRDLSLSTSWILNSWRVLVHLMPREGRGRHDEIRSPRFILPPNLRDIPTFASNSYSCIGFNFK